jgi:signal transduction histidine kinase
MEMGTLGEPREATLDALYAEAKQVLSQSANQLRVLTDRLRHAHSTAEAHWQGSGLEVHGGSTDATAGSAELAKGRQLLSRLELAVRDVEQCWLFLERGGGKDRDDGRANTEGLSGSTIELLARNVLEAQEEERTRIAEELHDGPAQALANAAFQVEVIDRTLRDDASAAALELAALRSLLDRELDRLRGFIHQLRPPLLDDGGLDRALEENAQRLVAEVGLIAEVRLDAPTSVLDGQDRMAVLRVAQEAMRNVRKHAGADRVWLVTSYEPGPDASGATGWVMEVRDDGRGFDVESAMSVTDRHHFGLRFMRERTTLIGGRLEILSEPGRGSVVRLTLEPGERSHRP